MLILGAGIAVLQKGLTLTRPKYEIHAQHRADVVDQRAGHDDRNGWSRSRNQRSRSSGITGHVAPEYPEFITPQSAIDGGVVRPGETVIELLPIGEELIVEAKIPPVDIAFVSLGQTASIKLDAYDSSIFGGLLGKVEYISADVLFAEKTSPGVPIGFNNPPSYYIVRVRITDTEFHGDKAREIKLRPGLTASVEIKAAERTVLSYLTKPITKTLSQSLGER